MARQNIQFKGLRHAPSDITGQDGDLLECVNLVHQNGELKPLEMPERMQMKGVWDNETLVAVHNLTDGKKFVFAVWNGVVTTIHVKDESDPGSPIFTYGIPHEEIQWVETIGNTLIIGTDKSTHYALYKNGQYKWLGDKLPQPVFEFDMESNANESSGSFINVYEPNPPCEYLYISGDHEEFVKLDGGGIPLVSMYGSTTMGLKMRDYERTEYNKTVIKENLLAKMATLTKTAKQKGKFIYPFFVRYAVRMFDGNYAMHSEPILMLPSTNKCPIDAKIGNIQLNNGNYYGLYGNIALQTKAKSLKYKFVKFIDENGADVNAEDWADVVKGVDLFLSSEVVSFDERYYDILNNIGFSSYSYWHTGNTPTGGTYTDSMLPEYDSAYVAENAKESWLQNHKDNLSITDDPQHYSTYLDFHFALKSLSNSDIKNKIEETNIFYLVKKYELNELKTEDWQAPRLFNNEVEGGKLERLETLPTLPDDYVSRSRMTGMANYNYNQRLILGNINLQAPLWYQDAKTFNTQNYNVQIWFEIEKPEKTIYVRWSLSNLGRNNFGHYLFYPDPDCKRAYVKIDNWVPQVIPMIEHTGLHGAYALMPDLGSLYEKFTTFPYYDEPMPQESTDRYYQQPNVVAMSSVANPFHFPATNFKDIGRAKVIGIAANMLDVSSAQWGQYPIYVFCSDGIIAVMIDGEGKMGGIQAVSADVLREPRGLSQPTLVQTGQTLMFLTQRGVMAIAGTKISCVSEAMGGRHFNPMRDLADVDYHVGAFQNLIAKTSDNTSFVDFAASGFLAYDYAHNRVMLLHSDKEYQYLFDMKTGLWSKQIVYTNLSTLQMTEMPGTNPPADRGGDTYPTRVLKVKPISGAVNNYMEMYLQDMEGRLYQTMNVMGENNEKQLYQYGYFISRPIRFGTDEYKTITRALHRYTHYANNSFVRMAMYGSRDGVKYGRINTLRGMSYQYFIFAIYTYLKPNERYSYLSVDFETRLNNKLR